jgi:hypothetical protein
MKIQLKSEITCPNYKNKDAIITDFTVKEKKKSAAELPEVMRKIKELKAWYSSEFNIGFMTKKNHTKEVVGASS